MSEKFKKIVNAPHLAFGRARRKIQGMRPTTKSGKVGRVTGIGVAGMFQLLLWATKYAALDNHVTRGLEKVIDRSMEKKTDLSKGWDFVKRNPNLVAHLIYYTMVAATMGVTDMYRSDNASDEGRDAAIKKEIVVKKEDPVQMLNPAADNFIDQCLAMENILSIPIVYTETYRAIPVVQNKESVWTHGFGMTWSRGKNGKLNIRDYADTKANRSRGYKPHKPQEHRTMDSDLEEAQLFLRAHVYPKIKRYLKRSVTENEFLGLCTALYQMPGRADTLCAKLNRAHTKQEIMDAFMPSKSRNFGGTVKRRWVCAMLAAGNITLNDILNADVDNFYGASEDTFVQNGRFVCDAGTINAVLSIKHKQKTRDVMAGMADGRLAMNQIENGGVVLPQDSLFDVASAMVDIAHADAAYSGGQYNHAADLYKQIIAQNPDNLGAYSGLILTYKKIGDMQKTLKDYARAVAVLESCSAGVHGKELSESDMRALATMYYNAAMAREAMGDIYAAQNQKKLAQQHYSNARRDYEVALKNSEKGNGDAGNIKVYQVALERMNKRTGGKRKLFVGAAKKLGNRAYGNVLISSELVNGDDYTV